MGVLRNLLSIESEWNPKIMMTRGLTRLLPDPALFFIKKHYYAYLFTRLPDNWMEEDAAALPSIVSLDDAVVDIGANIGFYSRLLARLVGQKGHVYAFEPIPVNFGFLCHNLERSKLSQVEPLPFALSDSDRVDTMIIPNYRWGQPCWYGAMFKTATEVALAPAPPKYKEREIKVRCKTLDSFRLPQISFIKCDAEYHELAVLRGGQELIRKYHPVLMIEVYANPDDPATSAHETFGLLASEGYNSYCLREGKMVLRQPGERSQNYFFLTPEHVQHYFLGGTAA